jgi:hypothetical protein
MSSVFCVMFGRPLFDHFPLAIALYVLLRLTTTDYPFDKSSNLSSIRLWDPTWNFFKDIILIGLNFANILLHRFRFHQHDKDCVIPIESHKGITETIIALVK